MISDSSAQNEWTMLGFTGRKDASSLDVCSFNIEEILFVVYREAQLKSKQKRNVFAANNGEVKPSLLYICVFEWGTCCKSLGPGS